MNAEPSGNKAQRFKSSSGKRQDQSQVPRISSQLKSSLVGGPRQAGGKAKESFYLEAKPVKSRLGPRCQGAPGNRLFLDFQSMTILGEDADEDSASDLSDSERVPIDPSPLTPPDLRLRAEEVDPAYVHHSPDQGPVKPDYCYPDFLPPPFNSWDLQKMAELLHAEGRVDAVPRVGGLLGHFIGRLVQLEWLQIQTVQTERAKGTKAKPPAAPRTFRALKSPGRSKLMAAALPKPLPHQEGVSRPGPSRKQDGHYEDASLSYIPFQTSVRPVDGPGSSRLCPKKQALETRKEEKRKRTSGGTRLQRPELARGDSSDSKVRTPGSLQAPRSSALILDSTDPWKAPRSPVHTDLKTKGSVDNGSRTSSAGEQKPKTSGAKRGSCHFK